MPRGNFSDGTVGVSDEVTALDATVVAIDNRVTALESPAPRREQHVFVLNFYTTDGIGVGIVPLASRVGRSVSLGDAGVTESSELQSYDFLGGAGQGLVLPPGKFRVRINRVAVFLFPLATGNAIGRQGGFAVIENGINITPIGLDNPGNVSEGFGNSNADFQVFYKPGPLEIITNSETTVNVFWTWTFESAEFSTENTTVKIDIEEIL